MVCRPHVRALLEYFTRQGRGFPRIFTITRLASYLVRDSRGREKGTWLKTYLDTFLLPHSVQPNLEMHKRAGLGGRMLAERQREVEVGIQTSTKAVRYSLTMHGISQPSHGP